MFILVLKKQIHSRNCTVGIHPFSQQQWKHCIVILLKRGAKVQSILSLCGQIVRCTKFSWNDEVFMFTYSNGSSSTIYHCKQYLENLMLKSSSDLFLCNGIINKWWLIKRTKGLHLTGSLIKIVYTNKDLKYIASLSSVQQCQSLNF